MSPVRVRVGDAPAVTSIWYWAEPPEAAPPGTTRLNALPAICVVATTNQRGSASVSRIIPQ